jgi:hypothetical protein
MKNTPAHKHKQKKHTSTKEQKKGRETPIIHIVLAALKDTITHRES